MIWFFSKPFAPANIPGVPEISSSTAFILLCACAGMMILVLGLVIGISRRLRRIEHWMVELDARREIDGSVSREVEPAASGAFEEFLNEAPERRKLPKNEQFAEYRRWRQEKGLNWSNS